MRLLVDTELNDALRQAQAMARGIPTPLDDGFGRRTQVQAASLVLTVGDIFVPGTKPDELGGCNNGRRVYELKQGHTVVIRTRETIHLGQRQAGIGFPPAFQSLQGLLMTNPGHVDPGYNGPLHCTVINMAHSPFRLERGDHIIRLLIFQLANNESAPQAPYYVRAGLAADQIVSSPIDNDLLDRLSVDFVDVQNRAEEAAKAQINKAQLGALWLPVSVAIIAAAASYFTSTQSVKDDLNKLRNEFTQAKASIENKDTVYKIQTDLAALKEEVRKLQDAGRSAPGSP
jgi:dCTP deaminase